MEQFGIDVMTEPVEDDNTVPVQEIECPLSAESINRLKELIDPMSDCSDYGIQLYLDVLAYVISNL